MIRENKIYGDAIHVRVPHALKMDLLSKAQAGEMTLSEFVLTQLQMIK